jgi:hypothetical protein
MIGSSDLATMTSFEMISNVFAYPGPEVTLGGSGFSLAQSIMAGQ